MHERIAIHPVCFMGMSVEDYIGQCLSLGARRVGFISHDLLSAGVPARATAVLADTDLAVESITHVFFAEPLSRADGPVQAARDNLNRAIDAAAEVGARSIYMLTGGHGVGDWNENADAFCTALHPCTERARSAGVELAVENASSLYAELHIAHTLSDTVQLAERAGIGVCMELFFCWAEANLSDLVTRALPRLQLVQVSDYVLGDRALPARAVPGDGAVPLGSIVAMLLDAGYGGAFDLELLGPRIETEGAAQAVARAAQALGETLRTHGA